MSDEVETQDQTSDEISSVFSRRSTLAGIVAAGAGLSAIFHRGASAADVGALQAHIKRHKKLKRERRREEDANQSWLQSIVPGIQQQTAKNVAPARLPLLNAVTTSLQQGDACRRYCETALKNGSDKALSECLVATQHMLPVCSALAKLTELDAKRLKSMANVSVAFLKDCEVACRKAGDLHPPCVNCANACLSAIRECQNLA